MRYRSKVDGWFYAALLAFSGVGAFCLFDAFSNPSILSVALATGFVLVEALLFLPLWLNTVYILEERALQIYSGFSRRLTVPYDSILSVGSVRGGAGLAALSLDRLEIVYSTGARDGQVLISPRNREDFLRQLYLRML